MQTSIYYFSGTGNSLAVAKMLCQILSDSELIPIMQFKERTIKQKNRKVIGIVFPIHSFTFPIPVREFLKQFDFSEAEYIFAIATRGGSPCRVFTRINRYLKKQEKKLSANFFIDMPNTWLLFWKRPHDDELKRLFNQAEEKITQICRIIIDREISTNTDHAFFLLENVLFPLVSFLTRITRYFWLDTAFYTDENCNACGRCNLVCPVNKIKIENNKPVWQKDKKCNFCFACIHYCPQKSIQLNATPSRKRDRYHHPEITFNDISLQKKTYTKKEVI